MNIPSYKYMRYNSAQSISKSLKNKNKIINRLISLQKDAATLLKKNCNVIIYKI